jgi:ankyrin repeat protein
MRAGVWIAAIALVTTVGGALAKAAETTLLDAAERGDRAGALQLLAKGANANAPGPDGTTAIMWAASNDDLELVRALIKAGANVTLKNKFGTSALTDASRV